MSLGVTISADDARWYPPLLRLSEGVQRADVRRVMGRAIAGALRRHFTVLDAERPNRLGGERTHFWGQVRRSVQQPELLAGDGVRVDINHVGAAQQYFGGEIKAKPGGWLTIPARAEAHGHRAREFTDLHFVLFRRDLAGLIQTEGETGEGTVDAEGEGGGIFYWLVKSVYQDGDETVLPPEEALWQTALEEGEAYIDRIIARAQEGT